MYWAYNDDYYYYNNENEYDLRYDILLAYSNSNPLVWVRNQWMNNESNIRQKRGQDEERKTKTGEKEKTGAAFIM